MRRVALNRPFRLLGSIVVVAFASVIAACGTADDITIEKEPVEIRHATIPQEEGSPIGKGHTQWFYHCSPHFQFEKTVSSSGKDVQIKLTKVQMKVGLTVVRSLPPNAKPKLIEHEDGHVAIAISDYEDADKLARAACTAALLQTFSGSGKDEAAAEKAAIHSASQFICQDYSKKTADVTTAVSSRYDQITTHGLSDVDSTKAVTQAFSDEASPGKKL